MPFQPVARRRIYLASSWRNPRQPAMVDWLRGLGHEVYDFRNPAPGVDGFAWSEIDPDWLTWSPDRFTELLTASPIAKRGYGHDKDALDWCDTCVLLLPCGRSAHLEAGYAIGQGKRTAILLNEDGFEPELMYLLAEFVTPSRSELEGWLAGGRERTATLADATRDFRLSAERLDTALKAAEEELDTSVFRAWCAGCVEEAPDACTPTNLLFGSFTAYCGSIGYERPERRHFDRCAQALWSLGESAGQVVYHGVRLIPTGGAATAPARDTNVLDAEAAS